MPGDPGYRGGGFGAVEARAQTDAQALVRGGVSGLIIENFGSAPFIKGTEGDRTPPHHVAIMATLARMVKDKYALPVGINCLRNDAVSAIGIAAATNADFVRVNVHTGTYVTDQGIIEGEAAKSMRYRASIGATVSIYADVLVKHASPLTNLSATRATKEALGRGGAHAVIVTGGRSGGPVDVHVAREVRAAAGDKPVIIGSGLTPDNAASLVAYADAAIVGTYFKENGEIDAPVDEARVRDLVESTRGHLWS